MDKIEDGEIVYCNLTVEENKVVNNKNITIKHYFDGAVYKYTDGYFYRRKLFDAKKLTKPLKVIELKVLARLGYENKNVKTLRNQKKVLI